MDLGGGVQWLFYVEKKVSAVIGNNLFLFIREMSEPLMAIRGRTFHK